MNRMRLKEPIRDEELELNTGHCIKDIREQLQPLVDDGLMRVTNQIALTTRGELFLNDILQCFLD